eukprot:396187-Amphidinium_carterae.1
MRTPQTQSGVSRFAHPSGPASSALSVKELHALAFRCANHWNGCHVEALGEDGETASLSTECWQEHLSSSETDGVANFWSSLAQASGPQGSKARGFDTELEEWKFRVKAANRFEELERDVASHAAFQPK